MPTAPVSKLLLITGLWPTADRPSAGIFVKRRAAGQEITVVAPRKYDGSLLLRYLALTIRALTVPHHFVGVEAHPLFPAGLIGLVAARLRRVPLVVFAHGADVRETAIQNVVYRSLAKVVIRGAAAIVANSADTADLVERLGGTPIVIAPGVDLNLFHPSPRPRARRVLYLGGTELRKGYEIARALADTLLGPGLRTLAPNDVAAVIAEHDIVLVPSVVEPFGLVAAEAIASGRWVVARAVGGLRDIVEDGITGTLVAEDADFAEAIRSVPDYDPFMIAARAARFSLAEANAAVGAVWDRVRTIKHGNPRTTSGRPADPAQVAVRAHRQRSALDRRPTKQEADAGSQRRVGDEAKNRNGD